MPLTTAQQVRLRIQDPWRFGEETLLGNGSGSAFKLQQGAPYSTLISATGSVFLPPPTGWTATGCTFDAALGRVAFSGIISANSAIQANYLWAVFGEDDIGFFTAAGGGSVAGAALQAVRALRFNAPKRARWASPDGTQYDDTQAMRALKELEDDLEEEVIRYEEGPAGDYASWAEEQENY